MKYVLLIHVDEARRATMTPAEREATMKEFLALHADLREEGHLLANEALQPVATARCVRVRGGQMQATDGPFAETREQIGGFYLVEAASVDEAAAIAARIPSARFGTVEVRPVLDFSAPQPPRPEAAATTAA